MTSKITAINVQARNPDRVNVSIDGSYRLSLDIFQVTDLGLKVGQEIDEPQIAELEAESQFGRLYARALEYCLMRPRSQKEVRNYLNRKTLDRKTRNRKGEAIEIKGVSRSVADRVYDRLIDKGYVDDEKFARFWVENRNIQKGTSSRKLYYELIQKGIERSIIDNIMQKYARDEKSELQKMINKKRSKYQDDAKLAAYLVRQGFAYGDVTEALRIDHTG